MKSLQSLVLNIFFIFFFFSIPFGQLGSIVLRQGINLYLHDIALLLLIFGFIINVRKIDQLIYQKFVVTPFLLFIAVCIVSLLIHITSVSFPDFLRGLLYLVRYCLYAGIAFVALTSTIQKKHWIMGLYVSGLFQSLIGFLQFIMFPSLKPLQPLGWDEHYGRLFGTLYDPNFMGMVLVLVFMLGFYYVFNIKKGTFIFRKSILWISQCLIFISIILTYSRSAYIALFIACIIFAVRCKIYKLFFAGVIAAALIYTFIPKGTLDVNRLTRSASSLARIQNWQQSIDIIKERPVFGFGFNLLRSRMATEKQLDRYGIVSRDAAGLNSSILFVFATTGFIGGSIYLWWLLSQTLLFNRMQDRLFGTIGFSSLIATVMFSFFNQALFYPWIAIWLFILWGIALREKNSYF